jgi:Holliday junction resolvase RusA-like endonuclease
MTTKDSTPLRTLTIVVAGHNPAPQGSTRYAGHRTSKTTGRRVPIIKADNPRTHPWRQHVALCARQALARAGNPAPMDGVIKAEIIFTMAPSGGRPKTLRDWPNTQAYGDLDKLQRATFDALDTDAGVIANDSRICEIHVVKLFAGDDGALAVPGAVVRLTRIDLDADGNKIKRAVPLGADTAAEVTA